MLTLVNDVLAFAAGFALCWVCKDTILKWVLGAKSLADRFEAKASAIKAVL